MKLVSRTCTACGSLFERTANRMKWQSGYCSLKCFYSTKTKSKTRICRNCGKTFANKNALRYCGQKCFDDFVQKRKKSICPQCGSEFQKRIPSQAKKYCSQKCMGIASQLPLREFDCLNCKKRIVTRMVRSRPRKFCSRECQHAYTKGDRSPLFRGNRRHYRGANWADQAKLARERDGNLCQSCGIVCSQKASVDHIVPFRLTKLYGDREGKDPNDLVNLISLCRSDHSRKTQAERKLLKGDVIGFIAAVRCFMPLDRVNAALSFWGLI